MTANMDTQGLLNMGNEEHFTTFGSFNEYEGEDSMSLDGSRPFTNEWDDEREINGDIALIPVSGNYCENMQDIADSPPSELFHRFVEWSLINVDVVGVEGIPPHSTPLPSLPSDDHLLECKPEPKDEKFDIAQFVLDDDDTKSNVPRRIQAPVKKIDLEAQKYITADDLKIEDHDVKDIDTGEDLIDVETVFDSSNLPVLEASDAFSLLEQFEATEKPNGSGHCGSKLIEDYAFFGSKVPQAPVNIFEEPPEQPRIEPPEQKKVEPPKQKKVEPPEQKRAKAPATVKNNKQIIDELPHELIARINESGKRKTITVIPPILPSTVAKKRKTTVENAVPGRVNKMAKFQPVVAVPVVVTPAVDSIRSDHSYCSTAPTVATVIYPKEPLKDSGFESAEEEGERSVLRNQPTVKNADGKLMVSLLKVNTIRNNTAANNQPGDKTVAIPLEKKKLNLAEYKKRRFINTSGSSTGTSRNTSPVSSTCSSPRPAEDENLRRIKHQEKLMKMAAELLNTPAKSALNDPAKKVPGFPLPVVTVKKEPPQEVVAEQDNIPAVVAPPPDLEVRTYVSIGTNTDVSHNERDLLTSVEHLVEIKPLLQKVSDKINSNSFITSLIENIPKSALIDTAAAAGNSSAISDAQPEDKIIQYLKKDRAVVETRSVGVQTKINLIDEDMQCRYRRRMDSDSYGRGSRSPSSRSSTSSYSSSGYGRRRRSSRRSRSSSSSSTSSSSSYSSRSRSRSRSSSRGRTGSPKKARYYYNPDRLREVEERRVVYVGRIGTSTTKDDLRRRFKQFGAITKISLHFRDYGDNYGFVTFANKEDAFEALEHGNDGYVHPKYDLSFGGRRIFCQTSYSDLDNVREDDYEYSPRSTDNSFDALLRAAQETIRKRKP